MNITRTFFPLLLGLVLCALPLFAIGQNLVPYAEVVETYYDTYLAKGVEDGQYTRFEKRDDGWYVKVTKKDLTEVRELFWSAKKRQYRKLPFLPLINIEDNLEDKAEALSDHTIYYYNLLPYYGYAGWDTDVIKQYGSQAVLGDTLLAALAKAYNNYSFSIINQNMSWTDTTRLAFPTTDITSKLSGTKLEEYRKYHRLAISTFQRLEKQNPSFKTFIGTIQNQVANEHLTGYLNLLMYSTEQEAMKELKPGLYSDFMISFAKNYLATVEKNGVLITQGDNDTYPLLYVQAQYGFRADVRVVNGSLLASARYIHMLRSKYLASEPLAFSISDSSYVSSKTDVVTIADSPQKEASLLDALGKLDLGHVVTGQYYQLPSNLYYITTHEGTKVDLELNQQYLFKNDLAFLDLLATNGFKRPVYIAVSVAPDFYTPLLPYCIKKGMAFKVESYETGEDAIDLSTCFNNLNVGYSYHGYNSIVLNESLMAYNNIYLFGETAFALAEEGKKDSALVLLNLQKRILAGNAVPVNVFFLRIMDAWYTVGEMEEGNLIASRILETQEKEAKSKSKNYSARMHGAIAHYIMNAAEKYGQTNLAAQCKTLLGTLEP